MNTSRGKQFEQVIRDAFEKVPGVSIDRLYDQTTGFKGSQNICDFIVYKYPHEYYFECKSVHGNTLPLKNITDTQLSGLLEKSDIDGVIAGIICWWIDKDVTKFIPIKELVCRKEIYPEMKSLRFDDSLGIIIRGKKKRVFFDYDIKELIERLAK